MSFLIEFWKFMRVRKKYCLVPVITLMLFLTVTVFLTKGSVVAPFIYTFF
jgi:hypothetical protein